MFLFNTSDWCAHSTDVAPGRFSHIKTGLDFLKRNPRNIYNLNMWRLLIAAFLFLSSCASSSDDAGPPNIIIVLTEGMGYGDLGITGNRKVLTPNINTWADGAAQMRDFHAQTNPVYSRAQLLTGRHALGTGVWANHAAGNHLNLDEELLPEQLRKKGYQTFFTGTWKLGSSGPYLPEKRGFDKIWQIPFQDDHQDPVMRTLNGTTRLFGWTSDYIFNHAIEVVSDSSNYPFFLYMSLPSVAGQTAVPDSISQEYSSAGLSERLKTFYGAITQLDSNFGRLMKALEQYDLADNTLVILIGDGGSQPMIDGTGESLGLSESERNPRLMRGTAASVFENGHRSFGFVRWGARFEPRYVELTVDIADLYPTILNILNTDHKESPQRLYGKSALPALLQQGILDQERAFFHVSPLSGISFNNSGLNRSSISLVKQPTSIRKGFYKLVLDGVDRSLYNVAYDLKERVNIYEENRRMGDELVQELNWWWNSEVEAAPQTIAVPEFHLGWQNSDSVYIPAAACDRVFGNIWINENSSGNWSREGDGLRFAIKVKEAENHKVLWHGETGNASGSLLLNVGGKSYSADVRPGKPVAWSKVRIPQNASTLTVRVGRIVGMNTVLVKQFYGVAVLKEP